VFRERARTPRHLGKAFTGEGGLTRLSDGSSRRMRFLKNEMEEI